MWPLGDDRWGWAALACAIFIAVIYAPSVWRWLTGRDLRRKIKDLESDHSQRIAALEDERDRAVERFSVNINDSKLVNSPISLSLDQKLPELPYIGDLDDRTVWIGTDSGDMRVRFYDTESITGDIYRWLYETGHQCSVSPERIRKIMHRLRQTEHIVVSDSVETKLIKGEDT